MAAAAGGGVIEHPGIALAERGWVPTPVLRRAIRRLNARRLAEVRAAGGLDGLLATLDAAPLAAVPELANAQHYELPAEFFRLILGSRLKYSCGLWGPGAETLDAAEEAMLSVTCERAELEDGQSILELGCGWGSLSLFLAERYPHSRIVAVSNSRSQGEYIRSRRPPNLDVVTADMNAFAPGRRFDRVVSVEMFEHMRNWRALFGRIAGWLEADGRLFVHVFCHARDGYTFESEGAGNWMGRHFFSGGIMPSFALVPRLAAPLAVEEMWWVDGGHYRRTAAAWRRNLEARRDDVLRVLGEHHGWSARRLWYHRWRLFLLACEELFGHADGAEWGVGHYRLAGLRTARGATP
ncbi:MAG TPA: cyclopropane-fatty-acyl-phospholipid synthase family protein [Gemmatimonadales bacterium]|nr:cyclopropane-fatty-acyl-phospholipid synthase family protein [Gemmatimonadales bacterium]